MSAGEPFGHVAGGQGEGGCRGMVNGCLIGLVIWIVAAALVVSALDGLGVL